MITLCEITTNPCRDIVEGVVKLRTVRTVPVTPFVCAPAAPEPLAGLNAAVIVERMPNGRPKLANLVELFRQQQGERQFTAPQLGGFLAAQGLPAENHTASAKASLHKLRLAGLACVAGRLNHKTKLWKFVTEPAPAPTPAAAAAAVVEGGAA